MNAAPLEYLLLDPHQKINYRIDRGITLQQWYKSFVPEKLFQGEYVSSSEATLLLQKSYGALCRLIQRESLQTFRKGRTLYLSVEGLNGLVKKDQYLIPLERFFRLLTERKRYMSRRAFEDEFKEYFAFGLHGNRRGVSLSHAARIISALRRRKEIIEAWPDLEALCKASGKELSPTARDNYYRRMVELGKLKVVRVGMYDVQGKNVGTKIKVSPEEFARVVTEEKENARARENGLTSGEIAEMMGEGRISIAEKISLGSSLGLLHPVRVRDVFGGNARGDYRLPLEEVELFLSGRIPGRRKMQTLLERRTLDALLSRSPSSLPSFPISPSTESSLFRDAKAGDKGAFQILLHLYFPGRVSR